MSTSPTSSTVAQHLHTVQFYNDDGGLLYQLERFIGEALSRGSSAIVIATDGHRTNLYRHLTTYGVDLLRAVAEGRYITLDAANALGQLMMNGKPDRQRFFEVIGGMVTRGVVSAKDEHHCVVAFGEMVALLWAEGKYEAALELERLWNELAKSYSFKLHCAYPAQDFRGQNLGESLLRICAEHTDVVGDENDAHSEVGLLGGQGIKKGGVVQHEHHGIDAFHLFVDNVQDYAIFMLDVEGRIITWNAGAKRIKGYDSSEIVGSSFARFYPEEDIRAGKPQRMLHIASTDGRVRDEGWRVRKDGSRFWADVTITAVRDESGKLVGFGKVTRDLTERRNAEIALQRSEQRSRLFVEAVQDYAIFMLDPEGYVSTWNVGAERIKGYKASEIIGQHFSKFYPDEDVKSGKPQRELVIAATEGRVEDEGWRVRKDGSVFWANVIITAVRDSAGKLLGFSKVTRDFTERVKTRHALEESERKLKVSEKSLRELSLHLLRTQDEERRLIGREMHDSLGQYLSVLKMKVDALGAVCRENTHLQDQLHECAMLVDQCVTEVRTVSYLMYPPMLEELGLKSAIHWYLEGFEKRSGIAVHFEADPDFERLPRDAELVLFRVLQEALTNVHKHSGSPSARIHLSRSNGAAILEVSDKGKGVPAAVLEKSGRDWTGSLGVGLRGMSERLRQLGGMLDLESGPRGTQLRASVPLSEPGVCCENDGQNINRR